MPTDTFSITSAANDGTGYKSGSSWPPAGAWTDYSDNSDNYLWIYKINNSTSPLYENDLTFLRFDTSSIADGSTVTGAVLKLYAISKTDNDNFGVVGDYYDFGGEPTVDADYTEYSTPSIWTAVDLSAITASAVNDFTLTDLTGISLSGYTGIRVTLSSGTPGIGHGQDSSVAWAAYEHASQEPRLEVTYTEAAGGSSILFPHRMS
jgi:hypothetical protein